eukprot:1088643-Prymnesium_polylepis.1
MAAATGLLGVQFQRAVKARRLPVCGLGALRATTLRRLSAVAASGGATSSRRASDASTTYTSVHVDRTN